jgi:NADH dehydrogenase
MHILLTGASGYIGAHVLDMVTAQGATVTVLGSVPPRHAHASRVRALPWRLGEGVQAAAFVAPEEWSPVRAIIHLAHDWNTHEGADERNQVGTRLLLDAARAYRVPRFVFVSSASARPDALNRYGRTKAAVEGLLRPPGEVAARVGLVYGGPPRGLYGTMLSLTRMAPVLPMVDAGQLVQPIHLDEVCRGLFALATRPELGKPAYGLAAETPLAFGAFLKLLARHSHGRSLRVLPIPRGLALMLADLSAKVPVGPTIDRERILGLAGIRVLDTGRDLRDMGLELVPVEEGLARPFRRRRLAEEGATLCGYCAGARVGVGTVRLYMRVLRRLGDAEPLVLPGWARRWPALVRLLDATARPASPLRRRLGVAARVAEAGTEPAERFHMTRPEGRFAVLVRLAGLAAVESGMMALRLLRRALP